MGSSYKILSKMLSCKLKEALKNVISTNLSAFLGGRQCVDGVLMANESLDVILKSGKSRVLYKLDLENHMIE